MDSLTSTHCLNSGKRSPKLAVAMPEKSRMMQTDGSHILLEMCCRIVAYLAAALLDVAPSPSRFPAKPTTLANSNLHFTSLPTSSEPCVKQSQDQDKLDAPTSSQSEVCVRVVGAERPHTLLTAQPRARHFRVLDRNNSGITVSGKLSIERTQAKYFRCSPFS